MYQLTDAVRRDEAAARSQQTAALGLAPPVGVEPLVFNPNNSVTVTVERLMLADGSTVVRKVLARDAPVTVAHWAAGANPAHWNYWRREADAYRSGAVHEFEPFVAAPEILGQLTPTDGIEVLYLGDAPGLSSGALTIDDLAAAAYRLGRAQARPADPPGPVVEQGLGLSLGSSFTSGSREWIWSCAISRPPGPIGYLDATASSSNAPNAPRWDHPVVIEGFGEAREEIRRRYGQLFTELPRWRRLLAVCPRTFCHLDFGPRNLVIASSPESVGTTDSGDRPDSMAAPVLVDWSFAGIGAVGEDPGQLVAESMLEHHFTPETYGRLDDEVSHAYAAGLVASGWPHDLRWARLAMCVAVLRYVWMPAAMVASAAHAGPTGYAGREGLELVEVFARRGVVFQHILERIGEAGSLAGELGLS